jgi:hypothetical protein
MKDAEFLAALESCRMRPDQFGHAGHVRAAYLYSRQADFAEALASMRRALRAFATSVGKPDRYHETITVAFMALMRQHLHERGDGGSWEAFAERNPELFERDLLLQYFPKSLLDSVTARQIFVLPRNYLHGDGDHKGIVG